MPNRKITFIGTGQVTAAIVAMLASKNKALPEEERFIISILGRKDSKTLEEWKKSGFLVKARADKAAEIGSVDLEVSETDLGGVISDDPEEIFGKFGMQDFIFVATKAYSHDAALLDLIRKLATPATKDGEAGAAKTSDSHIILAQNGVPAWLTQSLKLGDLPCYKEEVDFYKAIKEIGTPVGCVLNLACNKNSDKIFTLSTPLDKVSTPFADTEKDSFEDSLLAELHKFFQSELCGLYKITSGCRHSSLPYEILAKLQVNLAISGLSAITGKIIGEMIENSDLRRVLQSISDEVNTVSKKFTTHALKDQNEVIKRIAPSSHHYPSMGKDFEDGKEMETKAIYEAFVELYEELPDKEKSVIKVSTISKVLKILQKMEKLYSEFKAEAVDVDADSIKYCVDHARVGVAEDLENLLSGSMSFRPQTPDTPVRPKKSNSSDSSRSPSPMRNPDDPGETQFPSSAPAPKENSPALSRRKGYTHESSV